MGKALLSLAAILTACRVDGETDDSASAMEFERLFTVAFALHEQGVAGNEDAVVAAVDAFRKLHEQYPDQAKVLAFYGSACTLRARDVIFYRKMDFLREGFASMDKAIEQSPDCGWSRLIRGINSYKLPGFLGRRDHAREDFTYLVDRIYDDSESLDPKLRELGLYHAGLFAYEERDPRSVGWLTRATHLSRVAVPESSLEEALRKAQRRFGSG